MFQHIRDKLSLFQHHWSSFWHVALTELNQTLDILFFVKTFEDTAILFE